MARPSKEEVEKREKIKKLGLFVRDSSIYTGFEETAESNKDTPTEISYMFSTACADRSHFFKGNYLRDPDNIEFAKSMLDDGHIYDMPISNTEIEKIEKLSLIDIKISHLYFLLLEKSILHTKYEQSPHTYNVDILIYREDLINVLPEEKLQIIFDNYETANLRRFLDNDKYLSSYYNSEPMLSDEDLENLRKYYFTHSTNDRGRALHSTTITREGCYSVGIPVQKYNTISYPNDVFSIDYGVRKNKVVNVELDFTKPKEELIKFITKIKDDFDEGLKKGINTIPNIFDLLGDDEEIFIDSEIHKKNTRKPIGGRLADVLFIYDCRKSGLDNDYILDEINKYWTETRNLFKEKIQLDTLREYHNLAIDYIDNEKYKCYLSGYDLPN